MRTLLIATVCLICFFFNNLQAQNKAQPDNGKYISVVKSDKTLGRTHLIHYTISNISNVPVDFTLYKESNDGTWYTTHSLGLNPGTTYDDDGNAVGMTGRYVVYSAPHSDHADFPSYREVAGSQGAPAASPVTPSASPSTVTSAPAQSGMPNPTPPPVPQGPDPGAPRP